MGKHVWDKSGERCVNCGDKDWMAGPDCPSSEREARLDRLVSGTMPPPIERKQLGWKKRRKERLIMEAMQRATTPQTGWHIFQKVRRIKPKLGTWEGNECCELMAGLADAGYLRIVGNDEDCGWLYELNR